MSRAPVPFIFRCHAWSHSILSAWNSNFTGQGALATFVTIIGAKPLFDTWHVMMKKQVKGVNSAESYLTITRASTVVLDSLPQAAAQSLFFVSIGTGAERLWVILGSIAGCAFSISYLVATTELDLDTRCAVMQKSKF